MDDKLIFILGGYHVLAGLSVYALQTLAHRVAPQQFIQPNLWWTVLAWPLKTIIVLWSLNQKQK